MRLVAFLLLLSLSIAGHSQFSEIAGSLGLAIPGAKDGGATFADFNNDGCLDILVNTSNGTQRSRLLVSDCASPPSFTDQTATLAPYLLSHTLERSAVWGDFNNDGYLDFARNRSTHLQVYQNQEPSGNPAWSFGDAAHNPNFEITTLTNGLNCERLAWVDYNGDGFNFEALATVVGNGTTFTEQRYQHFHTQPAGGVNYYRLYQVDLDGKRNGAWYAIASLENEAFTLRAFPNPLLPHHRRWLVKVSGAANNDLTISLYGADGKLHLTESIFALENHLSFEFDRPASCTAGVYIVEVISGSRKLSRQLIFHSFLT